MSNDVNGRGRGERSPQRVKSARASTRRQRRQRQIPASTIEAIATADIGNSELGGSRPSPGGPATFLDSDPVQTSLEQPSRERYFAEILVDTVRESLVLLNDKLRVTTANQAFYTTFHKTPLQTEGKLLYELPGWEWINGTLRGSLERVAGEGERLEDLEVECEMPAVGKRTLCVHARQLRLPGEVRRGVLLAMEDITERKTAENALRASEERYRQIFESGREGIWILDAETGEILEVNRYLVDLLGLSREELIGRKPWELGVYEDPAAALERFQALQSAGHDVNADVAMRTLGGETVHLEAVRTIYMVGSRRVAQFNYRDITQRRQLEDQLRTVQKMESIGQLAGGLAHDFNNILNIISVYAAIIARDAESPKIAHAIGVIEKAIQRGAGVVHQLLTFARKTDMKLTPTDVNAIMRECAGMVTQTFPATITVDLDLARDLPSVSADANQLHQAVLNLCVNARDAMSGGGRLEIQTSRLSPESVRENFLEAFAENYVVIAVSDTGEGMDKRTRARAFEPFFTTKGPAGGSGLGLPVVYGIMRNHRGLIDISSEPGNGTTVRLYLPANRSELRGKAVTP